MGGLGAPRRGGTGLIGTTSCVTVADLFDVLEKHPRHLLAQTSSRPPLRSKHLPTTDPANADSPPPMPVVRRESMHTFI